MIKNTRTTYQNRIQSLLDHSIIRIVYHTFDDGSPQLMYDCPMISHILDHALLLQLDNGRWYRFFWGTEFEQEGIDFIQDPIFMSNPSVIKFDRWDVSSHMNWSSLIGQTIVGVDCHWESTDTYALYPHAIQLRFSNQKSISICPPYVEHEPLSFDDSERLMILFDEQSAIQLITTVA